MIEMRCIVSGKVQGVMYRDYVAEAAATLNINGYVTNQSNGTVLVVAQGVPEDLKSLVEYLHEGSVLSRVEGVDIEWGSVKRPHDDFAIIHQKLSH